MEKEYRKRNMEQEYGKNERNLKGTQKKIYGRGIEVKNDMEKEYRQKE